MNSILSDLYHGELRPNERDYPDDSDTGILLESFRQNEKWLAIMIPEIQTTVEKKSVSMV